MMKPVLSLAALGAIAASSVLTGCATPTDSQAAYAPPEVREYATGSRLPVRKMGAQTDNKAGEKVSGQAAPAAGG